MRRGGTTEEESPGPPGGGHDGGGAAADLSRLARDGGLKLAGNVTSAILGFVFVLIISRGLGATVAGRYFQTIALVMILANLAKSGADTAFIRYIPRYRALARTQDLRPTLAIGMIPILLAGVILGVLLFAYARPLSHILGRGASREALVPYVRAIALFLPFITGYNVCLSGTRGFATMRPLVVVDGLITPALRTLVAASVVLAGLSGVALTAGVGAALTLTFVLTTVWLYALLRRTEGAEGGRMGERTAWGELARDFWKFAGPRGFASIFATLITYLDTLLLGALRSSRDAGIYAAATRYMKFGNFALTTVYVVIAPQLSHLLTKGKRDRAQSVYQTSTWWVVLLSWPIYFTLAVFAPFLLGVFGKGFQAGQTALVILSMAMLVSMATGPVGAVLLMGGHSMWNLLNNVVALTLNIVLNLLLIPHLGITGSAIAWAVSIVVNNVAALVEVHLLVGLGSLGRGFAIVGAAAAATYGGVALLVRLALGATPRAFLLSGVIASGLYLAVVWRNRRLLQLPVLGQTIRSGLRGRRRGGSSRPGPASERQIL